MNAEDKDTLRKLWDSYGGEEIVRELGTIYSHKIADMPDKDWRRECQDSADFFFAIARDMNLPIPIRQTRVFQRIMGHGV